MAYNLARYNINPFNISGDKVRYIKAIGTESIDVAIGSSLEIFLRGIGNERVNTSLQGAPTKFISAKGSATVGELVAKGQPTVLLYPVFNEVLSAELHGDAIITPPTVGTENVECSIALDAENYLTAFGEEVVTADTHLSADIFLTGEGFELVAESASLEIIDTKTCVLTTTLRPGQKIIIDADSYTVLLDGENAIEIQSGDWIDELDRSTTDIAIKAASGVGNLTTSIIYTERYL